MGLKSANAESAQPSKMEDTTTAAPAQTAEREAPSASQEEWESGAGAQAPATHSNQMPSTAVGATPGNFQSLEGKMGFGSFPQVKLDKDKFVVGNEGEVDGFDFHAISAQSRWIYKANKDTFFFSYANPNDPNGLAADGRRVSAILADWKAAGTPCVEVKEYQEVFGHIKDGPYANRMVILSVPPVSVARLSGLMNEVRAFRKLETPDQYIMTIAKGTKIKTKSGDTFYPWDFKFKCLTADYQPVVDEAE